MTEPNPQPAPQPTAEFADHLLFDADWAPSPRRVRWGLAEKGVAIPTRRVDLRAAEHRTPAGMAANPTATVPALRLPDGTVIADSTAIMRLVEAIRADPPLFGRTPAEIGRISAWLNRVDFEGYAQIADWLRNDRPAFADSPLPGARLAGMTQIPALAERGAALWRRFAEGLETELGDEWLTGQDFTMADVTLAVACDFADAVKMEWTPGKRLTAWRARAAARPGASA